MNSCLILFCDREAHLSFIYQCIKTAKTLPLAQIFKLCGLTAYLKRLATLP